MGETGEGIFNHEKYRMENIERKTTYTGFKHICNFKSAVKNNKQDIKLHSRTATRRY